MQDQEVVAAFRKSMEQHGWKEPSASDCMRFIYQELGETDSILMRMGHADDAYKRTNDIPNLKQSLMIEFGEAYLMLLSLANSLEIDAHDALIQAMYHLRKMHASVNG